MELTTRDASWRAGIARLIAAVGLMAVLAHVQPAAGQGLTASPSRPASKLAPIRPNILILLADDVGVDAVSAYGEGVDPPPTPFIDGLASQGVLFRNAWSNPVCSPTRATIMTGRYSFRTGIGTIVTDGSTSLSHTEITLPEMLDITTKGAYAHGYFGKWHLSNASDGWPQAPNDHGWSWFEGSKGNFLGGESFFDWTKVTNGVVTASTVYATTDTVDSALGWIASQSQPWLAYVSFHAGHEPYHAPPSSLHTQDLSQAPPPTQNAKPYFKAMVEAMDTEIGRLLLGLGPALGNTVVIFLGDNGSAGVTVVSFDPTKAKGTVYQGGIRVPLIVAGPPAVFPGSECEALVNTTDLFATVAALGKGAVALLPPGIPGQDSRSIVPLLANPFSLSIREFVYAEQFTPNGIGPYSERSHAVRNSIFKLIRRQTPPQEELYDLVADPFEGNDLLASPPLSPAAAEGYADLDAFLESLGVRR